MPSDVDIQLVTWGLSSPARGDADVATMVQVVVPRPPPAHTHARTHAPSHSDRDAPPVVMVVVVVVAPSRGRGGTLPLLLEQRKGGYIARLPYYVPLLVRFITLPN